MTEHEAAALAEQYGLVREALPGGGVVYRNADVRLTVHQEPREPTWVTIGPVGGPRFGVDRLAPEDLHALLSGDVRHVPRLRRQQAVAQRHRYQQEWGTATGESPRFSSRPTLAALFADAANDGIIDARCYQAVWDWQYSHDELATHLGEAPDHIQRRLDRWEGLPASDAE